LRERRERRERNGKQQAEQQTRRKTAGKRRHMQVGLMAGQFGCPSVYAPVPAGSIGIRAASRLEHLPYNAGN
ncbi:MAG: hypothetical protein WA476_17755, partial [Acidobacteriaceae bacterium]